MLADGVAGAILWISNALHCTLDMFVIFFFSYFSWWDGWEVRLLFIHSNATAASVANMHPHEHYGQLQSVKVLCSIACSHRPIDQLVFLFHFFKFNSRGIFLRYMGAMKTTSTPSYLLWQTEMWKKNYTWNYSVSNTCLSRSVRFRICTK